MPRQLFRFFLLEAVKSRDTLGRFGLRSAGSSVCTMVQLGRLKTEMTGFTSSRRPAFVPSILVGSDRPARIIQGTRCGSPIMDDDEPTSLARATRHLAPRLSKSDWQMAINQSRRRTLGPMPIEGPFCVRKGALEKKEARPRAA